MRFYEDAILNVNKPSTWTSFDVVKFVRKAIRGPKIGHAGTLDPLADGVLLLCTGKRTKEIDSLHALPKTYEGEITFGFTTPSYDLETEANARFDTAHLTLEILQAAAAKLEGDILQIPPDFSAVKIDGERLYVAAREGLAVPQRPRGVTVHAFEILRFEGNIAHFRVQCGKGTYIRSLAYDLAKSVGSGATLTRLTRSAIGEYTLEQAWELQALMDAIFVARTTHDVTDEPS